MSPCGPRRSSRPTGTPTSTRSRRCSPRAASTRPRSSRSARSTATSATSTACTRTSSTASSRRAASSSTRSGGSSSSRRRRPRGSASSSRSRSIPRSRRCSSTTTASELPDWVEPEAAVLSSDGALTTTLVGILAERELEPTPLEATAFALGIHEDTGSLTYPTTTQRDVDALAWCLRHGARQDLVSQYLHTPLAAGERDLLQRLMEALEPVDAGGEELLLAALRWPEYVEGVSNLAHKIVDLTDATRARPPRRDGRARVRRRAQPERARRRRRARRGASAAAVTRRRRRRSTRHGSTRRRPSPCASSPSARARAAPRP